MGGAAGRVLPPLRPGRFANQKKALKWATCRIREDGHFRRPSFRSTSSEEMPSQHILALYQRHAVAYNRERSRALFEREWLDRFLEQVTPGGTILDLGCGMGEPIARYFIERGFAVCGVDGALAQIAACRTRFPEQTWMVADMRSLDLGKRFDAVLAWDSFFHLSMDDQRAMFARFAAHLQNGAPLMFTSGPQEGVAIGTYHGEPLHHASLGPQEYGRLLSEHGFSVLAHLAQDPGCGGHTVWLARYRTKQTASAGNTGV